MEMEDFQMELGEISELLAIFTIGTTQKDADRLVEGLQKISDKYYDITDIKTIPHFSYSFPELIVRPREAFHAPSKVISLDDAVGEISAESIMIYPPGIPLAIPGEIITQNAIDLLHFYEKEGGVVLSDSPDGSLFSQTIPFSIRKTVSLLRSKQNSTYRGMTFIYFVTNSAFKVAMLNMMKVM